jgi:hypothetical protein
LRWGRCPDVKKLLVDGFTTKIACPAGSFRVLVYPSGVDVPTSTLRYLSACLRTRRRAAGTQRPDALYADRGFGVQRGCEHPLPRSAGLGGLAG